jgi:hypothetical protein
MTPSAHSGTAPTATRGCPLGTAVCAEVKWLFSNLREQADIAIRKTAASAVPEFRLRIRRPPWTRRRHHRNLPFIDASAGPG